jgi:hypothetical protein
MFGSEFELDWDSEYPVSKNIESFRAYVPAITVSVASKPNSAGLRPPCKPSSNIFICQEWLHSNSSLITVKIDVHTLFSHIQTEALRPLLQRMTPEHEPARMKRILQTIWVLLTPEERQEWVSFADQVTGNNLTAQEINQVTSKLHNQSSSVRSRNSRRGRETVRRRFKPNRTVSHEITK